MKEGSFYLSYFLLFFMRCFLINDEIHPPRKNREISTNCASIEYANSLKLRTSVMISHTQYTASKGIIIRSIFLFLMMVR